MIISSIGFQKYHLIIILPVLDFTLFIPSWRLTSRKQKDWGTCKSWGTWCTFWSISCISLRITWIFSFLLPVRLKFAIKRCNSSFTGIHSLTYSSLDAKNYKSFSKPWQLYNYVNVGNLYIVLSKIQSISLPTRTCYQLHQNRFSVNVEIFTWG